jgi:hypothetical protein
MKLSYSFLALVAFLLSTGTTNANIYPTNPVGSAIFTPNQKVSNHIIINFQKRIFFLLSLFNSLGNNSME